MIPSRSPGTRRLAALQRESNVYDAGLAARRHGKAAPFEYLEHRGILRQDFREELLDPRRARDGDEVAQQARGDAQALMRIVHGERDLGAVGRRNDITPAARNDLPSRVLQLRHQRDVLDEVDIEIESDLLFREAGSCAEEAAIDRFRTGPSEGRGNCIPVAMSLRADFHASAVAQRLGGGVLGRVHGSLPARGHPFRSREPTWLEGHMGRERAILPVQPVEAPLQLVQRGAVAFRELEDGARARILAGFAGDHCDLELRVLPGELAQLVVRRFGIDVAEPQLYAFSSFQVHTPNGGTGIASDALAPHRDTHGTHCAASLRPSVRQSWSCGRSGAGAPERSLTRRTSYAAEVHS